ncbi:MAG: Fic family protein [Nannocystaceae bacterium]
MSGRTRNYRQLHESAELLWEKLGLLGPAARQDFDEKFIMSWIYHDFALEGTVLSVADIKASTDAEIISADNLIPTYSHVQAMREAIRYVYDTRQQKIKYNLDWLKKIHQLVLPAGSKDQTQYRKDNPIHRMYFHDLAPADKISYRMRKLTDWFRTDECKRAHPLEFAAEVHREVIRVFPWADLSGRVARLAMNHILLSESYWPSIVHHVDRQRYYEVLRLDQDELVHLSVDSMEQGMQSASRLYQTIVDSSRRY